IQQIANQLNKLVDVVNVEDMTLGEHLERELVLLKLKVRPERTDTVRGQVVRLGGRVLDPAPAGFILELTGSEAELTTLVNPRARLRAVRRGGPLRPPGTRSRARQGLARLPAVPTPRLRAPVGHPHGTSGNTLARR